MTRRLVRPTVLIAAGLLAAGCSGSTTNGRGTARTTAPAAPQTSAAPPTSAPPPSASAGSSGPAGAPDLATLQVQPGDLPKSWTSIPSTPTSDDAVKQAQMVACLGGRSTAADRLSRAEKDYEQGNYEITSNAQLMRSQADVDSDTALLRSPKINSCYAQAVRESAARSLPAGDKLGAIRFTLTPGANGGPNNVAAIGHGTLTVTANGQTATLYADVVFITGNRIEGEVDFTGVGAHVDSTLEETVATAVAQRIANA